MAYLKVLKTLKTRRPTVVIQKQVQRVQVVKKIQHMKNRKYYLNKSKIFNSINKQHAFDCIKKHKPHNNNKLKLKKKLMHTCI